MKITVHELLALQDEAHTAGREAERATNLAKEQRLFQEHFDRAAKAREEYSTMLKALSDELNAAHRDDIAETGEASFKAGVAQGREDAQRDCWHVVASMLQEIAKRPIFSPVRETLREVAIMARNGTISDVLEKTDSAPVE